MYRNIIKKFTFLLCLLGIVAAYSAFAGGAGPPVQDESTLERNALRLLQESFREVTQKTLPVVVEVNTMQVSSPSDISPFDLLSVPQEQMESELLKRGLGSGVIVRKDGRKVYVLTNNHIVGNADLISVRLSDRAQYRAALVGNDKRKDLALVVFETEESVSVAELGDSDSLQVGDLVFAVGNTFGFHPAVTMGVVSTLGIRTPSASGSAGFIDYIQTDATLNRGNSGGALVNIRGEVIGINTWLPSPSGGAAGLGFTIPINIAKSAIDAFIARGEIDYGWLGINAQNPLPEAKRQMGVENLQGAFVLDVFRGSPADKYGILPGDIILRINGERVIDAASLLHLVAHLPVEKGADFDIVRYGEELTFKIRISERFDDAALYRQRVSLWPGMSTLIITEELQRQLNLPKKMGEIVVGNVSSGGAAWTAGLRPGDVIKEIDGKPVKSLMDFYRSLNESSGRSIIKVYRHAIEFSFTVVRP
jgi:Do/DeqQ family serine protease